MTHKYLNDGTKMTKPRCEYHQKVFHAVMDYKNAPANATPAEIAKVKDAIRSTSTSITYTTYTAIKQVCRLPYPRIFAAVKAIHQADPHSIRFTVNRMGENTMVRLVKGAERWTPAGQSSQDSTDR